MARFITVTSPDQLAEFAKHLRQQEFAARDAENAEARRKAANLRRSAALARSQREAGKLNGPRIAR